MRMNKRRTRKVTNEKRNVAEVTVQDVPQSTNLESRSKSTNFLGAFVRSQRKG